MHTTCAHLTVFTALSALSTLALISESNRLQMGHRVKELSAAQCAALFNDTALAADAQPGDLNTACHMFVTMDAMRAADAKAPPKYTRKQMDFLRSLGDESGQYPRSKRAAKQKAVRREVRTLSRAEWDRLIKAMTVLKERTIDGKSEWDLFVSSHKPNMSPGAHFGPGFLPWHREYLHRFETALRQIDASVSLPYWDTRIDARLPDGKDSTVWTHKLFGNGNGHVVTGPFAYWIADEPMTSNMDYVQLNRALGSSRGQRCNNRYLWAHALNGPMYPFEPKINRDGLSDEYTSVHYEYAPSPDYCNPHKADDQCSQSELLYCDENTFSCTAKVQPGGNCTGLDAKQACYQSECNTTTGQCEGYLLPNEPKVVTKFYPSVWFKVVIINGGNGTGHFRPMVIATGQNYVGVSRGYVNEPQSFGDFEGQATIRVARPTTKLPVVSAQLRAYDSFGKVCEPLCLDEYSLKYAGCNGTISLTDSADSADQISYSMSRSGAHFVGLSLMGHPARWMAAKPKYAFLCGYAKEDDSIQGYIMSWRDPSRLTSPMALFNVLVLNASEPYSHKVDNATVFVHDVDTGDVTNATVSSYYGLALIGTRNPYSGMDAIHLKITVRAHDGPECTPDCSAWTDILGDGSSCSGYIKLHRRRQESRPRDISYTTWPLAANYLGWDMRQHRRKWAKRLPIVRFRC